jgi:hypothetical protein
MIEYYRVLVTCPDCTGSDGHGCFDGETRVLGPFETRREAEDTGEHFVSGTIWSYEVRAYRAASWLQAHLEVTESE